MTESIQSIINQISEKARALHGLLVVERENNASLLSKNEQLQSDLDEKLAEVSRLESKLNEQDKQMVGLTEQSSVSTAIPSRGNAQEIDELVKEIDYCISQLRK